MNTEKKKNISHNFSLCNNNKYYYYDQDHIKWKKKGFISNTFQLLIKGYSRLPCPQKNVHNFSLE